MSYLMYQLKDRKRGIIEQMFNPYQPYINNQQIIRVNGVDGANAFAMLPSSSVLLLDETAPRLFLAQTDGAGYKTISAYKLEPYVEKPKATIEELLKRVEKLERSSKNDESSVKQTKSKTE